jgi:diguanylate cyclase (GGDEF)-like protein
VTAINTLMEIIELTQEQLKHRIVLRTEELHRLTKLNKSLYNEMDQQKEIEVKLREGERVLRQLAYYDSLTGLPNRIYFHEILQNKLARADRNGTHFVVFFLDVDKFKYINDTHGHAIGDKYLSHTAQQLTNSIKEGDIAARLAGDEFILIFENISNPAIINKIAEKILRNVSVPLKINDTEITSTFSVGICIYPEDGRTVEELEKHADLAMYFAKKQSGVAYCYYRDIAKPATIDLQRD